MGNVERNTRGGSALMRYTGFHPSHLALHRNGHNYRICGHLSFAASRQDRRRSSQNPKMYENPFELPGGLCDAR
jgi:hypothetical protein